MLKKHNFRRVAMAGMRIGIALAILLFVTPTKVPLNAFVPPPGLAAAVIQAIPTILGLFKKKQPAKPSDTSLKPIQEYAQREQIAWRIVSASGLATQHIAAMRQVIDSAPTPDKGNMDDLNEHWTYVDVGITAIVQSKPKTSVFDTSSTMVIAINKLLLQGAGLHTNIKAELKYDPSKPDPRLLAKLKANIESLAGILDELNDSTGAEIEMIGDELAVLGTAPASAADGAATKAAGKKLGDAAFDDPSALDKPIKDLREQLKLYTTATVTVQ